MSNTEVITKRSAADPDHLHDSEEYESAEEIDGEVYDDEETEEVEVEIEEEDVEEEEEEEEEDEDGKTPVPKEKELDDDEDRKNPQFIPKKGYFYEHDDRTKVDDGEEEEEEEKVEEKPKKVVVKENDPWSHDKYEEVDQAPKSHDELSAAYGYDIRSEDQPPRARRRRRYGRGPNKYTRKWEEEEAYQKPRGGYRGRGGGGRGEGGGRGFRNQGNNRRNSRGGYEEDFPELADGAEEKSSERGDNPRNRGGSSNRRDRDDNASNPPPQRNRGGWERDRNDRDDREREFESGRGGGGGRGGRGGNRGGRGRRNEFTNRNRYPDRRDSFNNNNHSPNNVGSSNKQNSSYNGPSSDLKEREKDKQQEKHWSGHDDRRERPIVNGSTNMDKQKAEYSRDGGGGQTNNSRQQSTLKKPTLPFTNTEYTGSASLPTGNRNSGSNSGSTNNIRIASEFENVSVKLEAESGVKDTRFSGTRDQSNECSDSRENVSRENIKENVRDGREMREHVPEIRDAREIIKEKQAMREREAALQLERQKENNRDSREREVRDGRDNRDVNRRPPNKGYQNDRRSQMPPRLQQQHQQQQQQQQQQQIEQANAKSKRFSTSRQRHVESTMVAGGVPPNAVVSPQLGQGVGNLQPVVTGTGPMITSPVPVYPPAPTYYDSVNIVAPSGFDAQVYEASASPVTGNGHNHGPSVSPSLWAPHASAYATAPYPSPPTGPVPVPQPPYADPAAFIAAAQQTGPPMYAPPQFIQDPTIINYAAAQGAPFAAPYHPQGFQGYAQVVSVTPAPPPEMYHGGVTYYSTQNQIQRAPMIAPLKRPKTVLQLVEPPEKAKESHQKPKELSMGENYSIQNAGASEYYEIQEPQSHQPNMVPHTEDLNNYEPELPQHPLENITTTLQPVAPVEYKKQRSPSPRQFEIPEKDSWSAQMAELQSPTETGAPIASFSNESCDAVESPKAIETNTPPDLAISTEKQPDPHPISSDSVSTPTPEIPVQKLEISKKETKAVETTPEVSIKKEDPTTANNTQVSESVQEKCEVKSDEDPSVVKENVNEPEKEKAASPVPVVEDVKKNEEQIPPTQPGEEQNSGEKEIKDENA